MAMYSIGSSLLRSDRRPLKGFEFQKMVTRSWIFKQKLI